MSHAAIGVFDITELLEKILDYAAVPEYFGKSALRNTPTTELFILQRVCRRFQAVIQGSTLLRRKMHLELDTTFCEEPDLLPQLLPTSYPCLSWRDNPTLTRIRTSSFGHTSDPTQFLTSSSAGTALVLLGIEYHQPGPPLVNGSVPKDQCSVTTAKAGSPSWGQMKLTRTPRIIHMYLRVDLRYEGTWSIIDREGYRELYKTVIVFDTSQDTLGTFANRLRRLLELSNHPPARYLQIECELAPLRESGWGRGASVDLERLRFHKMKHEQLLDCGRRYGRCAFCYYATGTELCGEHEGKELKKVFAEL